MLRSLRALEGYQLAGVDHDLGRVDDFLFDDETWNVRYLVARTGSWLFGHKVLILRNELGKPNGATRKIGVTLTQEQIRNAPNLETDAPVSRQQEHLLVSYIGNTPYWQPLPPPPVGASGSADVHLRSVRQVTGYRISAENGEFGEVADFIVDDQLWMIRHVVIDTRRWFAGRQVLLAPEWVKGLDWASHTVSLSLTRGQIEQAPSYDHSAPALRQYEAQTYGSHGSPDR